MWSDFSWAKKHNKWVGIGWQEVVRWLVLSKDRQRRNHLWLANPPLSWWTTLHRSKHLALNWLIFLLTFQFFFLALVFGSPFVCLFYLLNGLTCGVAGSTLRLRRSAWWETVWIPTFFSVKMGAAQLCWYYQVKKASSLGILARMHCSYLLGSVVLWSSWGTNALGFRRCYHVGDIAKPWKQNPARFLYNQNLGPPGR